MKRLKQLFRTLIGTALLFTLPALLFAEVVPIEKILTEAVSSNQSRDSVQAFAVQKAKRLALEEAGTFLSSQSVVQNGRLTQEQLTALASGILKTRVIFSKPLLKQGMTYIQVKVRIDVDTSVLEQQVSAFMNDKKNLQKLEAERRKNRTLENQLANVKSTELKRLEELNAQALALEAERDRERLKREANRLKALGSIKQAELEQIRAEQKQQRRIEAQLQANQKERHKELRAIAAEQDRRKKMALENARYWKEVERKAQAKILRWISLNDSLSLQQAREESQSQKSEVAQLNSRLKQQWKQAQKNLKRAYQQQIKATKPHSPSRIKLDEARDDPFATTREKAQLQAKYDSAVKQANKENQKQIKQLKAEEQLKLAQLKLEYLQQKLQVVAPFVERLKTLQARKFALPQEKITVTLGSPDADNFRFPITFKHKGRHWKKYWKYSDRNKAKALWKTRTNFIAEALFQLQGSRSVLVATQVLHPGTGDKRSYTLRIPEAFKEITEWEQVKNREVPPAEKLEKFLKKTYERAVYLMSAKLLRKNDRYVMYTDKKILDQHNNKLWSPQDGFEYRKAKHFLNLKTIRENSPYAAFDDQTVFDKQTKLLWEQKTKSNRDKEYDWQEGKNYCRNLVHGFYDDWRLPSKEELESLLTHKDGMNGYGAENYINIEYFPHTQSSYYWSSTTYVPSTTYAWYVSFVYGYVYAGNATSSYYVRCVRGGA